eukprot:gene7669-596_t
MSGYQQPPYGHPSPYGGPPPQQPYGHAPPQHPYSHPPPQHYGQHPQPGYGAPPQGLPYPPPQDPIAQHFHAVAGPDGQITAESLRNTLSESGISAYPRPGDAFSLETCRIMIAMLDTDFNGTMGLNEFRELCRAIEGWKSTFQRFDRDQSGTIEAEELHEAIRSFGYNLSRRTVEGMVSRYSRHSNHQVLFDDFIALSVRLRAISERFRSRDKAGQGYATIHYEDFIGMVMSI